MSDDQRPSDPYEAQIWDALTKANIAFAGENHPRAKRLDFILLEKDVHIEVKAGHTPRVADQLSRTEAGIVAQGPRAVAFLANLIRDAAEITALRADRESARLLFEKFAQSVGKYQDALIMKEKDVSGLISDMSRCLKDVRAALSPPQADDRSG